MRHEVASNRAGDKYLSSRPEIDPLEEDQVQEFEQYCRS